MTDITDKIDIDKYENKVKEIMNNHNISRSQAEDIILKAGPKKLYKAGMLNTEGWKVGFTKPSLEKRKKQRRKKNKNK